MSWHFQAGHHSLVVDSESLYISIQFESENYKLVSLVGQVAQHNIRSPSRLLLHGCGPMVINAGARKDGGCMPSNDTD